METWYMNNRKKRKEAMEFIQLILSFFLRNFIKVFWLFPIKNNKILFCAFTGKLYGCNPRYVSDYIQKAYPSKFKIIWLSTHPKDYSDFRVKFIKLFSIKHLYHFCTSHVIVDNMGMPTYMPKRKGQFFINTWHGGGAYKRVGGNFKINKYRECLNKYKSERTNMMISSSKIFEQLGMKYILGDYYGEILRCGMPRNDLLLNNDREKASEKVRHYLNIRQSDYVVLYAPTFRGEIRYGSCGEHSNEKVNFEIDIARLRLSLATYSERNVIVLFRHHIADDSVLPENTIDVSSYPDMQELLCASDMLISDFSSTIWDFSLLNRPCLLFAPDCKEYGENVGFLTPIETWPGILCRTNEELEQAILNFDEAEYVKKVEKHHADLGSYETGHACEQVCKRIAEVCGIEDNS